MKKIRSTSLTAFLYNLPSAIRQHKFQVIGVLLIIAWCFPYLTSGSRIEWGDFSFFAQAYEAIRRSILDYGQFPWWNPWVAGGVPLYANPQMGVFSIQTLFVLIFGAPIGLKLAIIFYTFAGYASMQLLLRKHFKIQAPQAIGLSLLWLFCSFFVMHLPSHFTFVWYMLTPLYVYLSLTLHNWKTGALLGLAFAVMALSAVHNPFFHLSFVCGAILATRLIIHIWKRDKSAIKQFLAGLGVATAIFLLIAGHRLLLVFNNVSDFPREVVDPAPHVLVSALGIFLPYSSAHNLRFLNPNIPAPYGFGEITATIGIFATIAILLSILFILHQTFGKWKKLLVHYRQPLIVFSVGLLCFSVGLGAFIAFSPYGLIKHIPIFGEMRVASRWFIFFDFAMIIFLGLMIQKAAAKSYYRFALQALIVIGVIELFVLNMGYQNRVLSHDVIRPREATTHYPFVQTGQFGRSMTLPNGTKIPDDGNMPAHYREYEATLFNTGVLQANDALVDLNTRPTPRCALEQGCQNVLSSNATITHWSPNKIVLKRTAPGKIKLNMNNSDYFVINGQRQTGVRTAEPYKDFYLPVADDTQIISIEVRPPLLSR